MDPWDPVRKQLLDLGNSGSYYGGGTLFVPFGKPRVNEDGSESRSEVGLNLDGTGFVIGSMKDVKNKNSKIYLPKDVTLLVRVIYMMHRMLPQ